jgi:hypothetical protein
MGLRMVSRSSEMGGIFPGLINAPRGGRDKPGHDEAKRLPYGTTMASGLPRCRLTMSLLRAPR